MPAKKQPSKVEAGFPDKLQFLFQPHRYKVAWGGRAGGKSWGIAAALLIIGTQRPIRVLCARETQKSIADSVHKLLGDTIKKLKLQSFYQVLQTTIRGANGTEFIFAGIKQNVGNIKSYEACDIAWVEEANNVSKHSWDVLTPTIRKEGSEIWISFNPELETDETYQRFVVKPPTDSKVVKINWDDNPFLPNTMHREIMDLKEKDLESYQHIYEGICRQVVEGAIYKEQLIAAEREGRITRVPYDPIKPVDTFWDLGWSDSVSIWFAQSVAFEFRIIDFITGNQRDIPSYLKEMQERGYVYGTHFLPHDAQATTLAAGGRTCEQQVRAGGRRVNIVPKVTVEDGIAAGRAIFSRCWFDAEKCAEGLRALRHYRYEWDLDLRCFKKNPLHDWASHPADAFRYMGVAIAEERMPDALPQTNGTPQLGQYGWMAY